MAFRRLAYHRSWFLIGVAMIGLVAVVSNCIQLMVNGQASSDDVTWSVLGGAVLLVILARGLTGSWSKRQLRVDVPAGKLALPDGSLHDLDAIGALTIERRLAHPKPISNSYRRIRTDLSLFLLRAANVKYYLFESPYEAETTRRLDALEAAVLCSRVRRILERPQGEGAFRSGPDALREVRETSGDRERVLAALRALRKDPDPDVRAGASSCLAQSWT